MENNWLNLMHLLKNDYDSKINYEPHLKQNDIFDKLITEKSSETINLNPKINCNVLTYYFKIKESRPKSFSRKIGVVIQH